MNLTPLSAVALAAVVGVSLDRLLGEPKRWHPLVGFGQAVSWMERVLRRGAPGHPLFNRLWGLLGWCLLVLPLTAVAWWLRSRLGWWLDAALLYLAIGARSLEQHALAVARPLQAGDMDEARRRVGWMVSRHTAELDEEGVSRAAVESVLENGNDAVFGTLFWFCLGGGGGALLFRLANTLDAMWGYKDERRIYFGWAAARIDDLLNLVPARLTALTYALLGNTQMAWRCWQAQSASWSSPNAGPVMAAGAGALGLRLGGAAIYHGKLESRPLLGDGRSAVAGDIPRAAALVRNGLRLWLLLLVLAALSVSIGELLHA